MKKFSIIIIAIILVGVGTVLLIACKEPAVIHQEVNNYDPTIVLSGDVDEVVKFTLIDDDSYTSMQKMTLVDVLSNAKATDDIDGVFILTHGTKGIYINSESIPFYYFVIDARGIIRLYSDIATHANVAEYPLVSVSEIVICSKNNSTNGLTRIFDDKTDYINTTMLFKAFNFVHKISETIDSDTYKMVTCNKQLVPSASFLFGKERAKLIFEDGNTLEINQNSTVKMCWCSGGIYLADGNGERIVAVDFRA